MFRASHHPATIRQPEVVKHHLTHCSLMSTFRQCISRSSADESFSPMLAHR